jgi:ADP-ribose pyrophosphatase YjhB (NUDIX family)
MEMHIVVAGYMVHEGKVLLILHNKLRKWLPPGGHIEKNETPDDAVLREFREEVGIEAELLGRNDVSLTGNIKRQLAVPFYANVHNVGDHDHCCLYYICRPRGATKPKMLESEISGAKWFSAVEMESAGVPEDVRSIAGLALKALKTSKLMKA